MTRLDRWESLRENAFGAPPAAPHAARGDRGGPRTRTRPSSPSRSPGRSSLAECVAEPPAEPVQAHADGRLGAPELAAEVAARAILPVVGEDEPAVLRSEAVQGAADRAARLP